MKKILTLALVVLVMGCGDTKAMKIEKPQYYVKLNMVGCPRIVTINGVEVESDFDGGTNLTEYPINHLIRNGENSIELAVGEKDFVLEAQTKDTICEIKVLLRGKYKSKSVEYLLTNIKFTANYTGNLHDLISSSMPSGKYSLGENNQIFLSSSHDFEIGDIQFGPEYNEGAGQTMVRSFTADVPFDDWAFFSGEKIYSLPLTDEEYEKANSEIYDLVVEVRKVFEARNLEAILPLFEMRSKEIDQAFYKASGTTASELKKGLEYVIKNDFPLIEQGEDTMELSVSYDGKLVSKVDAENMTGTVLFRDTNTGTYTAYTIYWMKKDGKWIIAR